MLSAKNITIMNLLGHLGPVTNVVAKKITSSVGPDVIENLPHKIAPFLAPKPRGALANASKVTNEKTKEEMLNAWNQQKYWNYDNDQWNAWYQNNDIDDSYDVDKYQWNAWNQHIYDGFDKYQLNVPSEAQEDDIVLTDGINSTHKKVLFEGPYALLKLIDYVGELALKQFLKKANVNEEYDIRKFHQTLRYLIFKRAYYVYNHVRRGRSAASIQTFYEDREFRTSKNYTGSHKVFSHDHLTKFIPHNVTVGSLTMYELVENFTDSKSLRVTTDLWVRAIDETSYSYKLSLSFLLYTNSYSDRELLSFSKDNTLQFDTKVNDKNIMECNFVPAK